MDRALGRFGSVVQIRNLQKSPVTWSSIMITQARLRQARSKSDTVNRVSFFYTFAGSWVISVSRSLGK